MVFVWLEVWRLFNFVVCKFLFFRSKSYFLNEIVFGILVYKIDKIEDIICFRGCRFCSYGVFV